MIPDPTEEIKTIRRKLAAAFDNDVRKIGADIRRQQRESGRSYITLPRRQPTLAHAADHNAMHRSGEPTVSQMDRQSSPPGDL